MKQEIGHGQPPLKGPGGNLTQGAGLVDLVDGNAPPNIDTSITRPCTVHLNRLDVTKHQEKQQINKFNLKPCTVHLQNCLSRSTQRKLKIQTCGSRRCETCPILNTQSKFLSSFTKKEYHVSSSDAISFLSCKSRNVIYLLSCQKCGLQYVGETGRALHERISGHRKTVRKKEGIHGRYFSKQGHNFNVQIIEKITPHENETETSLRSRREECELYWQKELGTMWPFGLNDRIKGVGNVSKNYSKIGCSSQLVNTQARQDRSHGHRKRPNKFLHSHVSPKFVQDIFNQPNGLHLVRSTLYEIPLALLHSLKEDVTKLFLKKQCDKILYHIIKDISYHRLFKPTTIEKKLPKQDFIKLTYNDRGIDYINLSNILHNKKVQSCIPPYLDTSVPKLSYKYSKTIQSKIFNHIKTIDKFTLDNYMNGEYPCPCHNSPYISGHHGHVITGDLSIIPNDALRKLISKGPKYREQNKIAWGKDKKIIMNGVEEYARKWAKKDKFNISILDDWVNEIKDIVCNKIKTLQKRIKQPPHPILKNPEVESCLQNMHENYVFAPADKASNNVIIICKKFYYKVIIDELGLLDTNSTSATYEKINVSPETLLDKHQQFLSKFNIQFSDEHARLPNFFSNPKVHKNSITSDLLQVQSFS